MLTLTINNPLIESSYTQEELKMKFINFLNSHLKEDKIEMYEVSVENLPKKVSETYNNFDQINFVER